MNYFSNQTAFGKRAEGLSKKINSAFWIYNLLLLTGFIIEALELSFWNKITYANYFFYASFAYSIYSVIFYTTKRQKLFSFFAILSFFLIYIINITFFPANNKFINESIFSILTSCLPYFLLALNISDFEDLFYRMRLYSPYYIILAWFLIVLTYLVVFNNTELNYMQVAYAVILPISIIGILLLYEKKTWLVVLYVMSLVGLLFIGCRGAFLAIIASFFISNFLVDNKKRGGGYYVLIILIILFLLYYQNIILLLGGILSSLGFNSRILLMFQTGGLFESASREELRGVLFSQMVADGYPMYGLFGDRFITQSKGYEAIYAHNIIVEFLVDFGLLVGGILLLCLLFLIIKVIKSSHGKVRSIITMFVTLCVTKLLFSNSYLIDPLFYCMLGLLFSYRNHIIQITK